MNGFEFLDVFALPFMQRAVLTMLLLSIAAGVVGFFISFRDLEFITDGLIHAVFPGLVIGYIVGGSPFIVPGAFVAALLTVVLLTITSRKSVMNDAIIAVLLTGMFSFGIVLVSQQEGYMSQLESLLFGHLLTVTDTQLVQVGVVSFTAIALVFVSWRWQLFRSFDSVAFEACGRSVFVTDLVLNISVALLVVAGVQALGNLMVLAILVIPVAIARQWSGRLVLIVPLAIMVSAVCGMLGLLVSTYLSFATQANVSASASVVLCMVAVYGVTVGVGAARTRRQRCACANKREGAQVGSARSGRSFDDAGRGGSGDDAGRGGSGEDAEPGGSGENAGGEVGSGSGGDAGDGAGSGNGGSRERGRNHGSAEDGADAESGGSAGSSAVKNPQVVTPFAPAAKTSTEQGGEVQGP